MINFILSLLIAFWGTYFATKFLKRMAIYYALVDKPGDRKKHRGNIPLVGGISVYIGFILSLTMIGQGSILPLHYFFTATGILLVVGMLDDKYNLRVRVRIFCEFIAASIMMFAANDQIACLGDLFALGDICLGWFAVPFTCLAILGAINAFNMVDGIDGLVGGLALNTVFALAILFLKARWFYESWICLALVSALLPFLLFNLTNTSNSRLIKVFMGDAGSMFIGMSVVWMLSIGTQGNAPAFKPVTALWIIAIPLIDMTGVIIRRIKKGQSAFKPDRDHLHHIFMNAGFSSKQSLIFITGFSLLISAIGIVMDWLGVPEVVSFALFLLLFVIYLCSIKHVRHSIKILELSQSIVKLRTADKIK